MRVRPRSGKKKTKKAKYISRVQAVQATRATEWLKKSVQKLNLDLSQTVHFDLAGNVNKMLQVCGGGESADKNVQGDL